ncbi:MAG: hypothetical protein ACR2N8_05470 [Parvibaculales bacterium]
MDSDFEKLQGCKRKADKLLGGLYILGPCSTKDLMAKLYDEGVFGKVKKLNPSLLLSREVDKKRVRKKGDNKWYLTDEGKRHVEEKAKFDEKKPEISREISKILENLDSNSPHYKYVKEFAGCFDHGYLQASIIMAWSGAIWLLREHVAGKKEHRKAFNEHAKKKHREKWKNIQKAEDFENHKDKTFLDICRETRIFTKAISSELQDLLKIRNDCGHPSSATRGKRSIEGAIEFLVINIYKEYPKA